MSHHTGENSLSYFTKKLVDLSSTLILDTQLAVKLHFAFLQYPTIEFYGLSRGGSRNRDLLIALAWLLAKQDCLNVVFRTKLINSVLGAECSHEDSLEVGVYEHYFYSSVVEIYNVAEYKHFSNVLYYSHRPRH